MYKVWAYGTFCALFNVFSESHKQQTTHNNLLQVDVRFSKFSLIKFVPHTTAGKSRFKIYKLRETLQQLFII